MNFTSPYARHPLVTLSIISHGDVEKTVCLLESIRKHEQTEHIQLLLTDNLGDDLPDFSADAWAELTIIRNEYPQGFARNHNQAFCLARGKYFCVLNPDTVFEHAVFAPLLTRLETAQVDMIAPLVTDSGGCLQDSFRDLPAPWELIRRRLPGYRFLPPAPDPEGIFRPGWVAGIFLLMPSQAYRQLGGFDERYRLYFEDVDFCTRARLAGFSLGVDSRVRLRHDAQRSSHKKLQYLLWHIQSAIRFFSSPVYRQAREG